MQKKPVDTILKEVFRQFSWQDFSPDISLILTETPDVSLTAVKFPDIIFLFSPVSAAYNYRLVCTTWNSRKIYAK